MSQGQVIVDSILSSAHSVADVILETTIRDCVLQNVNRHSDKIAIVSDHENISVSFAQLFDDCCNLAENLVTRCGLKHGDHVAIATGNCYSYFVSFLACASRGLIIWHYDPNMAPKEVDRLVETVKPVAIFTMGANSRQHEYFTNMTRIIANLSNVGVKIIAIDGDSYEMDNCYHIEDLLGKPQEISLSCVTRPSDPLLVLVTSGSTGKPKIVMWSNRNVIAIEQFWYANLGFTDNDKMCLPLSIHHAFAPIILRSLLFSGHQVILPGYRYSLSQTVSCLVKYECNYVALVTTMLHDILGQVEKNDLKLKLSDIILSGAALSEKVACNMRAIFPNILCHQFYAMSEMYCTGIVTKDRFDTVGKPLGDCRVKVVDDAGKIVKIGQEGRLLVKTSIGMLGYLKQDGGIDTSVFDDQGYFDTGDLFKMDEEGYLYYQGRVKDIINRAGFKISPKEVEAVFLSVEGVLDCLVIGIPDKRLGEEAIAVVQVEPESRLSAEDFVTFASDKISRSKMPRKIHISTEPLPRLTSLKHDKQTLRANVSQMYA